MLGFLWLVGWAFSIIVFVALLKKGYPQRLWVFSLPYLVVASRWSVRPLFAVALLLCLVPVHAQSNTNRGSINDSVRFYWNPAHWGRNRDGSSNPCTGIDSSVGRDSSQDASWTSITGPAGEPSPCNYRVSVLGYMMSDGPAIIKAILATLVVILAIWQGPRVLKKMLTTAH